MQLVEQLIAPRHDMLRGVDYSKDGKILVKKGSLELIWRPGSSYWSGMYGTKYSGASLGVLGVPTLRVAKEIHRGGRLSKALIHQLAGTIDQWFGEGTASLIKTKKTLVFRTG